SRDRSARRVRVGDIERHGAEGHRVRDRRAGRQDRDVAFATGLRDLRRQHGLVLGERDRGDHSGHAGRVVKRVRGRSLARQVEDRKDGMAGEKILCVDDDDAIRKLCTVYLAKRGYRVEAVANGVEALRLVESKGPPDLVVTDVNMPLMNGLELVKRLREDRRTARTPIIVLSAAKQEQDILAGYSHGADDYIGKPIDLAVLAAKIETIL